MPEGEGSGETLGGKPGGGLSLGKILGFVFLVKNNIWVDIIQNYIFVMALNISAKNLILLSLSDNYGLECKNKSNHTIKFRLNYLQMG